ncbi:MAG: ATP-binding protein, partial [Bacteroidota bacterium]
RAWMHYLQGNLQDSKKDYLLAIEVAKKIDDDYHYHKFRDKLTTILFEEGKKDEALEIKYTSIAYFKEIKDTLETLSSLGLLGHAYSINGENEKWLALLHEQLSYKYKTAGNIETYGNLGIVHYRLGNLDSAIYYIEIADSMGVKYPFFMMANRMYLAKVYHKKGEKEKAAQLLEELNEEYKALEQKDLFGLKMLLAEYSLELNELEKATQYFEEAEGGLLSQDWTTQQDRGYLGYKIQKESGNLEKALKYYQIYHAAKDSMNQVSRDSAYQVIESKYQLSKKEEEIGAQQLKLKNLWIGVLGLGAVIVITGLIFFFRNSQQNYNANILKEKTRNQELEIKSLQKENQLIALQSIIKGQEDERHRIARDLHDNIGSMVTAIKLKMMTGKNDSAQLDGMIGQVSDEIRRISHNMTPLAFGLSGLEGAIQDLFQQLKKENIQVHSQLENLDKIEDEDRAIMTYRIFQELINYILKHSDATEVQMNASSKHDQIEITISDNGRGLQAEAWENTNNMGLKNIKSRIEYLGGIITLGNSEGTQFSITIPKKR